VICCDVGVGSVGGAFWVWKLPSGEVKQERAVNRLHPVSSDWTLYNSEEHNLDKGKNKPIYLTM
jgi:hypothetical protein